MPGACRYRRTEALTFHSPNPVHTDADFQWWLAADLHPSSSPDTLLDLLTYDMKPLASVIRPEEQSRVHPVSWLDLCLHDELQTKPWSSLQQHQPSGRRVEHVLSVL